MLTFDEARKRLKQETGQPVLPYGMGDDRAYFIGLDVPRERPLMCGEPTSHFAVDKITGEVTPVGPVPDDLFFRSYKAPERFGDFPNATETAPERS